MSGKIQNNTPAGVPVHVSLPQHHPAAIQAQNAHLHARHPGYLGSPPPVHLLSGPTIQAKSQYSVTVGTYMHQNATGASDALAGHSFVSVDVGGRRETWGFSPAGSYDLSHESARTLSSSKVGGRVHRDDDAFRKPGVRTQTFEVSKDAARAAMAKITQYQSNTPAFNLNDQQCSTFALDVARAAGTDLAPGRKVVKPREMWGKL